MKPKWLLIGGVFGFLMLLQRNAGVFYMGGVVIGFCYYFKKITPSNKIYLVGHFVLVFSGFLVWNILRLWIENDIPVFEVLLPELTLARNLMLNFHELGLNFFPYVAKFPIQVLLGVILVVGSGILILKNYSSNTRMLFLYVVFVFYFISMSIIPANIDDVGRFMSITLPIVYLLAFYCLDQLMKIYPQFDRYIYYAFGVWSIYPFIRIVNNIIYWYERGG